MSKPLILVTNDDGIVAPGIRALIEVAKEFGEVIVVAPDSPQSGQGHAITIDSPLRINKVDIFPGIDAYECSGTPADCVKLSKHVILKNRKVDLCISGINHGSNASINILYSGTMSAAMEASLEGIDSIGFSLCDFSFEADFTGAQHYARIIIKEVLKNGLGTCKLLNVNIPKLPLEQIKGMQICKQGEGNWAEEFKEAKDPRGNSYYWLAGAFKRGETQEPSDLEWLDKGYVSIVPSKHDLTDYNALQNLKNLNLES